MNAYIKEFDVLVVYTSGIATSATSQLSLLPFDKHPLRAHYNDAYAYFLKTCELQNITAAFTTTLDLDDEGNFKSFWVHEKNTWIKKDQLCKSNLIFDKFSPVNALQRKNRKKLFSHALITSFNHPETFSLFFDKQKTFDDLSDFTIPTVSIKNSDANLEIAYQQLSLLLKNHPNKDDFSNDLIVKDRYGAGGDNIHKMKKKQMRSKSFEILHDNNKSFVIQPFVNFNKGHGKGIFKGFVDIRIVFVGKNLIQSYIRKPKKADFKCNEHQGGSLQYISKKEIPAKVMKKALEIVDILHEDSSLFALDFIVSNNGNVYLMEGNSGPGIDWNLELKKNERHAKKLIREIVKALKNKVPRPTNEFRMLPMVVPPIQRISL